MTSLLVKGARVQTILVNSLQTPPPPVFYSEENTVVVSNEDIFVEIQGDLDVVVCKED